jgi:hypothetical protein
MICEYGMWMIVAGYVNAGDEVLTSGIGLSKIWFEKGHWKDKEPFIGHRARSLSHMPFWHGMLVLMLVFWKRLGDTYPKMMVVSAASVGAVNEEWYGLLEVQAQGHLSQRPEKLMETTISCRKQRYVVSE